MGNINIYINSSNRWNNVQTIKQMPDSWREFCFLVVPFDQIKKYEKNVDWPIIRIPKNIPQYLSSQRQWVMENAECDYVWVMDDDLKFYYRNEDMKLRNSKEKNMKQMLGLMEFHLRKKKIPIVGISTRMGNNRVEDDYEDIARITRCYAINRKTFFDIGANFAPFEPFLKQDFHVNLTFLKRGLRNRVIYLFAQGDNGSNSEGGVSSYRTPELMKKIAFFMEKEHKPFVKIKEKKTKGSWEGFPKNEKGETIRIDINIAWKRAFESGKWKRRGGFSKMIMN